MSNALLLNIREEEVTITGSMFPLKGTVALPATTERRPAILVIPGTGTSDRDGMNKKIPMAIYKELAQFLTNLGFVTLRYDKRGVGQSGGDYYETGFRDLVEDATACVEFLKNHPAVESDKIIILGHSEGCFIAPAVNSKVKVQGLILLSGACESFKDAMPRQSEMAFTELRNDPGFKGFLVRKLNLIEKQRRKNEKFMKRVLDSTEPSFKVLWVKVNAKWMREHFAYNVVDELKNVDCPTIAITGDKDIQVVPEHARLFAEHVQGESEWHIVSGMTHILRKTSEELQMLTLLKSYKKLLSNPMDEDLLGLMENWLDKYFGNLGRN